MAALLARPLPVPPAALRQGPLREGAFPSPLHSRRNASILGIALGVTFGVCFLTGVYSHLVQNPPSWFHNPSRPVWLYRVTQGTHVATGLASVPLLLAKLWTVYPRLWEWPPVRSIAHAVERASLLVLVGGAVFQLGTGVANIAGYYPWKFFFTPTHYAAAWVTIGAMVVHIGTKAAIARDALRRPAVLAADADAASKTAAVDADPVPPTPVRAGLSRRGFLYAVGGGVGAITVATVGETVGLLAPLSVLGVRDPRAGVQHTPVNRTAGEARVLTAARDPGYRLSVEGPRAFTLTLDDLRSMPQHTQSLPITCVEGWSVERSWTGVRLRDLLDRAGAPHHAMVRVVSLEKGGLYAASVLDPQHARDPLTLLALRLSGQELALDHGFPLRLIAPNRPGVMQTKWVHRVVVLGPGEQRGLITAPAPAVAGRGDGAPA